MQRSNDRHFTQCHNSQCQYYDLDETVLTTIYIMSYFRVPITFDLDETDLTVIDYSPWVHHVSYLCIFLFYSTDSFKLLQFKP